jgi:hypothetical protein
MANEVAEGSDEASAMLMLNQVVSPRERRILPLESARPVGNGTRWLEAGLRGLNTGLQWPSTGLRWLGTGAASRYMACSRRASCRDGSRLVAIALAAVRGRHVGG